MVGSSRGDEPDVAYALPSDMGIDGKKGGRGFGVVVRNWHRIKHWDALGGGGVKTLGRIVLSMRPVRSTGIRVDSVAWLLFRRKEFLKSEFHLMEMVNCRSNCIRKPLILGGGEGLGTEEISQKRYYLDVIGKRRRDSGQHIRIRAETTESFLLRLIYRQNTIDLDA